MGLRSGELTGHSSLWVFCCLIMSLKTRDGVWCCLSDRLPFAACDPGTERLRCENFIDISSASIEIAVDNANPSLPIGNNPSPDHYRAAAISVVLTDRSVGNPFNPASINSNSAFMTTQVESAFIRKTQPVTNHCFRVH